MRIQFFMVLSVVALSALAVAKDDPPTAAASPAPLIGEVNVQTFPALNYYHVATETSFAKIGDTVGKAMQELSEAGQAGAVRGIGPTMLVYEDAHFDAKPDRVFKMQAGILAAEGAKPMGNFKLRKTEPFKCATVLYTGPVGGQGQAYQKLYPAIARQGLTRTNEEREMCLYWEGYDSPNNVFLIQVGIK
jgi:hypothetical protein